MMRRPALCSLATLALVSALAACGGPPPAPPTVVTVTLRATTDANGGAPVSLRLYQLASPAGLEGAQFFPVFNDDAATLKDDIVKRDDLLLAPGQTRTLTLSPPDRAHAIGVFAGFRDYEHQAWRATAPIAAHQAGTLVVVADKAGVTARPGPASAP